MINRIVENHSSKPPQTMTFRCFAFKLVNQQEEYPSISQKLQLILKPISKETTDTSMSEYRNGYPPLLHLEGRGLPVETLHSSGYDQHLCYGCRSTTEMERRFLKRVGQWYIPFGQNIAFGCRKAVCTYSARPFSAELPNLALSVFILCAFPD